MTRKQLRIVAPESLQQSRTIFRAWNQAVVPFRYRSVEINAKLLAASRSAPMSSTITAIRQHTRHISIREELDWDSAVELISNCRHVTRIKNFESLGQVVAQSPNLRVLRLTSAKLLAWKRIKVPPIRGLELKGCSWDLTSAEVDLMWSLENLESLTIQPIFSADSFFSSLQSDSLQELQTLNTTASDHPEYPMIKESLTRYLDHFIAGGRKLERLN
ncbi:hypothetical protein DL95DRAFT_409228 [Leptodontidium sp. 2 PMI_412]|nr:hypothetical protein DL95DRAFT_409228 [Leptodontidium sp. 2 PMI_412]